MKQLFNFFVFFYLSVSIISCRNSGTDFNNNPDFVKIEKKLANTPEISGVLVFIKSEPLNKYKFIGTFKNDFFEQVGNATKGNKFGQAVKGLFNVTNQNVDFQKLLSYMVENAKKEYPDVKGLIFKDNLSTCEVIKFE